MPPVDDSCPQDERHCDLAGQRQLHGHIGGLCPAAVGASGWLRRWYMLLAVSLGDWHVGNGAAVDGATQEVGEQPLPRRLQRRLARLTWDACGCRVSASQGCMLLLLYSSAKSQKIPRRPN